MERAFSMRFAQTSWNGTSPASLAFPCCGDWSAWTHLLQPTLLLAEIRNSAQGVVEPVREIGDADHQRKLDNLAFVVVFAQLLQRTGADRGSAAGDALGVKNRGLLFFVEERASLVELQRANLLVGEPNPLPRSGVRAGSILATVEQRCFQIS